MKTKACHCCAGSGEELDHKVVGAEMRKLRHATGLTLAALGELMKPKLKTTYLCDLELGNRRWNARLIEQYKRITA